MLVHPYLEQTLKPFHTPSEERILKGIHHLDRFIEMHSIVLCYVDKIILNCMPVLSNPKHASLDVG